MPCRHNCTKVVVENDSEPIGKLAVTVLQTAGFLRPPMEVASGTMGHLLRGVGSQFKMGGGQVAGFNCPFLLIQECSSAVHFLIIL